MGIRNDYMENGISSVQSIKQKLISIIIPVYNVRNYLDRCMDSVVSQTHSNIEIIVIDDGSDDGSEDICDKWKRRDSRIKVFHKKNGGASSARNLGLEHAQGEYIGFVDSDDYIKNDMYEELLKYMDERTDIVCCGTRVVYPVQMNMRDEYYDMTTSRCFFKNKEAMRELLLKRYLSFSPCDKLFRKKIFEQLTYPVGKTAEDLPVIYEAVKRSTGVVNIGMVKYHYCYREDSVSRKAFEKNRINYVLFARDICKDVALNYPNECKAAETLYIRNIIAILQEIEASGEMKRHLYVHNRLKRVLLNMCARIWVNEHVTGKMKRDIIKVLFAVKWGI